MSGLQARGEDVVNGVDVREQGSALRVATNTPHLVSLGTGRLSTAVTLHPIKQGRVTIGSDPTCDIYVAGTGVAPVHCRVENSHGVVTLYPVNGSTLLDGMLLDKPTRLSQGSMLTIGRSNYLRFNHPEEAKLMKSVLPSTHLSMAPVQFTPNEQCLPVGYVQNNKEPIQCYQSIHKNYKDNSLTQLDQELDMTLKDLSRKKPPVAPRKPYKDLDQSDSNSDQETRPKVSSIMAKVSKFEYYAKQQKNLGRSQFYTTPENEISPKVFSSNSLTVNTPAKDVLGGKNLPNYINKIKDQKVLLNENNSLDPKNCSYANVSIRKTNKIEDIVRNFDENNRLPKKINNDVKDNIYGKINNDRVERNNLENKHLDVKKDGEVKMDIVRDRIEEFSKDRIEEFRKDRIEEFSKDRNVNAKKAMGLPSPAFDRNPQYSPVYANCNYDRNFDAEHMRVKAYQDRIKEEEQKEAETARLEEILNMCAEYERQITSGIPITPTEKRPHNKIITNGSLPRSVALNTPNLVQTSDGYYKFETSHTRSNQMSQSLPVQRNLSSYENFNTSDQLTPEVTINQSNYENIGRMDEIGIPVFDDSPRHELSSPIMIRKLQNGENRGQLSTSPIGSPYENVYYSRGNPLGLKPKSPNTQSPRTRIKTTFAHKNLPSPQYFVFPTPPPVDNNSKPNFNQQNTKVDLHNIVKEKKVDSPKELSKKPDLLQNNIKMNQQKCLVEVVTHKEVVKGDNIQNKQESPKHTVVDDKKKAKVEGIEKQLSLEEEIPMIDDADLTDDIEFRYSTIIDKQVDDKRNSLKDEVTETKVFIEKEKEPEKLLKNKSFEDVKKELMADIPELDEFEKDLKENNRDKIIRNITEHMKKMDMEADSLDSVLEDNVGELKEKYEKIKEERKKLVAEIHELKNKMTEIRSQEDDILRELEMEKALIKGEYDSEIAILNIEQKKKANLLEQAKKIEEEIRLLKEKQESRQNEMRDRVEIATLKVERIDKDMKSNGATLEELQNAQDILDNETKIFEDLEFQHLEEESELLANREDIQNEIIVLTKKIESQKCRIMTLKSEANDNLTSALDETKILQAEYVRLLNQVEELTTKVQGLEKELKPIVTKLTDIERTQSPDSAFFTDQTRAKSGEFGYSPQSSDSDDLDITKVTNFEDHTKQMKDKFNSIDRMSQSMIVDIEKRVITDLVEGDRHSESPSKSSTSSKEKKGFWERNFDSLKRKKKPKSPEKVDIMSQSLNENFFYNNESIEQESFDKFNSLRHSKKKEKPVGPVKSNSSSKIPTFAALGKIIKKDSFGKKSKEKPEVDVDNNKNRYIKNSKVTSDNKYKAKSLSPEKTVEDIQEEVEPKEAPKIPEKIITIENFKRTEGKIMHRKSCGDEPSTKTATGFQKISDSSKIPSQDDIDRISKVTMDAPILSSDTDMNSLGKRTLDSLKEIERKRMVMLEEQGCQVIENEREKISELKRRVQDETKKLWDQKCREQSKSLDSEHSHSLPSDTTHQIADTNQNERKLNSYDHNEYYKNEIDSPNKNHIRNDSFEQKNDINQRKNDSNHEKSDKYGYFDQGNVFKNNVIVSGFEKSADDSSYVDDSFNMTSSTVFDESSGLMSSSIEELQVRNSRTESTEDEKRSDDSRPLSHVSDFSRDNVVSLSSGPRRSRRAVGEWQRPLTRYLPVDRDDFDLRTHVESAGHQIELCPYVTVNSSSCRGYLHKLGAKFHTWSKRWFVFDRESKTFVYYWDKSEKKPRGGAYFQVIEEVYLDHGNTSKSPSPQTTFIVKTRQRRYYLMAPSGEAARIWIDVIFTGAQGYAEYLE